DWLGSAAIQRRGNWRPFKRARIFARSLGLKGVKEWRAFSGSPKKPVDIPSLPDQVYADAGWVSYGDWLGTGTIAAQRREFRPFNEALDFVRSLGLKSVGEWRAYTKSGKNPGDIPTTPESTYKNAWRGYGHWLGTGNVAKKEFRPFNEAREF